MLRSLKEPLDLAGLARQGAIVEASMGLADMPRVAGLASRRDGAIAVEMEFSLADGALGESLVLIVGSLRGLVPMQCQRCLEPVAVDISGPLELALTEAEAPAPSEEGARDVIVLSDLEDSPADLHRVRLMQLLEDEVLLRLPLVPMHDERERCGKLAAMSGQAEQGRASGGKTTPFAGLGDLVSDAGRKN